MHPRRLTPLIIRIRNRVATDERIGQASLLRQAERNQRRLPPLVLDQGAGKTANDIVIDAETAQTP